MSLFLLSLIYVMNLEIKDYLELERLGLNYTDAEKLAQSCITIRELEYILYLDGK